METPAHRDGDGGGCLEDKDPKHTTGAAELIFAARPLAIIRTRFGYPRDGLASGRNVQRRPHRVLRKGLDRLRPTFAARTPEVSPSASVREGQDLFITRKVPLS